MHTLPSHSYSVRIQNIFSKIRVVYISVSCVSEINLYGFFLNFPFSMAFSLHLNKSYAC